jgi:hypothetical protein
MNNAEVYLRPKELFTARNARLLLGRLKGGAAQLTRRLQTMSLGG